jgi:hypothetical protein
MRFHILAAAAALLVAGLGQASAQGTMSGPEQPADPVQSKQVDESYRAACEPKASKELCACLIGAANVQINDPAERMIFYYYTTGEVEKARTQRATFPPDKNMKFNVALQKAETLVHDQCDKLRPAQPGQRAAQ